MKALLFIEDEANQRELTERLYQMCAKAFHGEVQFLTSSTWSGGLEIMRAQTIDVLLLDLVLMNDVPPMDRERTLKAVAETPDLPPIIALTGLSEDPFLRDKCFLAGFDDFMTKQDANHHPEYLCEKAYHSYMRRQRDLRREKSA